MSSQGGFFSGTSASAPLSSTQPERQFHLRAVVIKQINNLDGTATDEPITIDGAPVENARIVARVRKIDHHETGIDITFEDTTGSTIGRVFRNEGDDFEEPTLGSYVVFYAFLRRYMGQLRLNIWRFDTNPGPYLILYHEMEALQHHLHFTGKLQIGSQKVASPAEEASASAQDKHQEDGGEELWVDSIGNNPLRKRLASILEESDSEDGLHIDYLCRETRASEDLVRQEIAILMDKGFIYPGDTDYWLWTGR